jgi:DNA-binding response OmpR family regulator
MGQPRKKILCIEDDREAAALIVEALADQGFDPIAAHDGREGFDAILEHAPDLVLCDINLPVMSGFEVLERLNGMTPRLCRMPFIFLTALVDRDDEVRGRRLGADDYVVKPVDFEELYAIINDRLADVACNRPRSRLVPHPSAVRSLRRPNSPRP